MAEDAIEQRTERKAPWTKIFTAFKVALDIKKLLLAAAGILAMAGGWWLLSVIFYNMRSVPQPVDYVAGATTEAEKEEGWKAFKQARERWDLLYELAGPVSVNAAQAREDAGDIALSYEDYQEIKQIEILNQPSDKQKVPMSLEAIRAEIVAGDAAKRDANLAALNRYRLMLDRAVAKPHGRLRTWPWFEDRGPNPYLLVSEKIKEVHSGERSEYWPRGSFVGWFVSNQLKVLLEPLVKLLSPIAYFFDPRAGGWNRLYLLLVILWMIIVWGYFGGAITRMAVVQVARNEKISMREALQFARARCQSFISAPIFPLVFLGILTFFLILFGLVSGLIPVVGDIFISGLLWPIVLVLGLIMAVVLVGLIGWPLMNPTISAEGSDSFDALSRSYSYVYQAPWHYLWYSIVALAYGAALIFFVGFMGSLIVYLGEWGIKQTPFLASASPASDREPTYLFVYAPTSFGWRDILLHGSRFAKAEDAVTPSGNLVKTYVLRPDYVDSMRPWNYIGAVLVSVWLYVLFLLIVGFGYSFFWTASSIIYLLMRHKVDDTDLDEVHLEEEPTEEPFANDLTGTPAAPTTTNPASPGNVTMVEAPALRTGAAASVAPGVPPVANPPATNDVPAPESKPGEN